MKTTMVKLTKLGQWKIKQNFHKKFLIYFSSNNQKMELTSKCFPQQTVQRTFLFSPLEEIGSNGRKTLAISEIRWKYQGSCLVGQDWISSLQFVVLYNVD